MPTAFPEQHSESSVMTPARSQSAGAITLCRLQPENTSFHWFGVNVAKRNDVQIAERKA